MNEQKYPFAVRLLGFEVAEGGQIGAMLRLAPSLGPGYFLLHDDALQEPDLFIVNGNDLKALAALSAAAPSVLQPALIVGAAAVDFPFPHIERPLDPGLLFLMLADLIDMRADAMARSTARGLPEPPERRRRKRLDLDLTDPAEYVRMRRAPPDGAVLIVDRGAGLRDHVAALLGQHRIAVEWTESAATALMLCDETSISLVLVNCGTPAVDPYQLCSAIKTLEQGSRIAVVLLVGGGFAHDSKKGRNAGVRGILDKPVADRHLAAALKKLLSLPT